MISASNWIIIDGLTTDTGLAECDCSIAVSKHSESLVALTKGLAWGVSSVGTETP